MVGMKKDVLYKEATNLSLIVQNVTGKQVDINVIDRRISMN